MLNILFALFLLILSTATVEAQTLPTFPSCTNPQGDIKANYSDGVHGIVGSSAEYRGRDTVYALSEDAVTQCFCPASGSGIQTNWFKASSLSDNDINILKNDGWIWVPTGAVWGLSDAPYVALNSEYACNERVGGDSATQGDTLGALAHTGDIALIIGTGAGALGFLLLGIYLLYETRKNRSSR